MGPVHVQVFFTLFDHPVFFALGHIDLRHFIENLYKGFIAFVNKLVQLLLYSNGVYDIFLF